MASKTKNQDSVTIDSERLLESAIESNLQMTYEKRIEAHENARQLLIDLQQAGEELRYYEFKRWQHGVSLVFG